jgi:hypothetical protein
MAFLTFPDFPVDKRQDQFHNSQRKSKSEKSKVKMTFDKAEGGRACG